MNRLVYLLRLLGVQCQRLQVTETGLEVRMTSLMEAMEGVAPVPMNMSQVLGAVMGCARWVRLQGYGVVLGVMMHFGCVGAEW